MAAVKSFHRHDGTITLHDGSNGMRVLRTRDAMETPRSMLSDYLDNPLPVENLFFPINGRRDGRPTSANVNRLNSVFADIDYAHDRAPDANLIEREIARFGVQVALKVFPMPSYIVRSGRGVWLHYLLREPDSDRSVVRCPETTEQWREAGSALRERLAAKRFPVDSGAKSLTQFCRVPHSINTDSRSRVLYTANCGIDGRPLLNTLDEVLAALGVKAVPRPHFAPSAVATRSARSGIRVPNRGIGQANLIARRERDFDRVVALRGGAVRRGARNNFARALSSLLSGDPARAEKVRRFCKEKCRPALPNYEIRYLLKNRYKLTDRGIADLWHLTPGENSQLEADYYAVRGHRPRFANQRSIGKTRRELIQDEYGARGAVRVVQRALADEQGIVASLDTVGREMKHNVPPARG
jgi:hypothetical protein